MGFSDPRAIKSGPATGARVRMTSGFRATPVRRGGRTTRTLTLGMAAAVAVACLMSPQAEAAAGSPGVLDLGGWKAGDVHVHASGDSSLLTNRMCRDDNVID